MTERDNEPITEAQDRRPAGDAGAAARQARGPFARAGSGFLLGVLLFITLSQLGLWILPGILPTWVLPAAGVLGAAVANRWGMRPLWLAGGALSLLGVTLAYTPLMDRAMPRLVRVDPLEPADAVVLAMAEVPEDLNAASELQYWLLYACLPLRQGCAHRLVVVKPAGAGRPLAATAQEELRLLGVACPVEEAPPARTLREEAVAVSRLAHERGWRRVIVVCPPAASRRTAGAFEKAGVAATSFPCGSFIPPSLPGHRVGAFGWWLGETVYSGVYRLRGWL